MINGEWAQQAYNQQFAQNPAFGQRLTIEA